MNLGDRARDIISGFEGLATAYTKYLNGCERYFLEPEGTNDGRPHKGLWFDAQQLTVVERNPKGLGQLIGIDVQVDQVTTANDGIAKPRRRAGGPPIHGDAPTP